MAGSSPEDVRQVATEHWEYTEKVLSKMAQLGKTLYIEAFIHGYKHGLEDSTKSLNGGQDKVT